MHNGEAAATAHVHELLERRRTAAVPIERVRLAVAHLHTTRRQLAIPPHFDEQFLSPGDLKSRDAYELEVARRLVAEGRFVCALPSTTTIDGQLTPDFVVTTPSWTSNRSRDDSSHAGSAGPLTKRGSSAGG